MRSIPRGLVILTLILGVGCDTDEPLDSLEVSELEALDEPSEDFAPAADAELGEDGGNEPPAGPTHVTDVTPPPSEGTCGGYREITGYADFQGCGTCTHTVPEPDRDGNLGLWYERWCWTGPGCSGCEPWVVIGGGCYDICG